MLSCFTDSVDVTEESLEENKRDQVQVVELRIPPAL